MWRKGEKLGFLENGDIRTWQYNLPQISGAPRLTPTARRRVSCSSLSDGGDVRPFTHQGIKTNRDAVVLRLESRQNSPERMQSFHHRLTTPKFIATKLTQVPTGQTA